MQAIVDYMNENTVYLPVATASNQEKGHMKSIAKKTIVSIITVAMLITFAPASVKATEKSEYPCIKTVEGNKYCYTSETAFVKNAWQEIGGMTYWFGDDGVMAMNTIAGTKAKGFYYVGKDGARVTSNEMKLAVKFVLAHSNSKLSKKAPEAML